MSRARRVRISEDTGQIVIVDKAVNVRIVVDDEDPTKKTGDDVRWFAQDGGGPWLIRFAEAEPFSEREYTVPKGGSVSTVNGPVNGEAGRAHSYDVVDPSTGVVKDVGVVKVVASLAETDDEAIEGVLARLADVDDPAVARVVANLTAFKATLGAG